MSVYTKPLPAEREVPPEVTEQDVLDRAADLLEEFGWCQGTWALNEEDEIVGSHSDNAVRFCALGAIGRASCELGHSCGLTALQINNVMAWNDTVGRTKDAVVLALRAGLPQFRNV